MMQRWLVIAVKRGMVKDVSPFTSLSKAKKHADEAGDKDHHEDDYVIVWDLAVEKVVYGPF